MHAYGTAFDKAAGTLVLVCLASVLSAANICVGQAIWSLGAVSWGMSRAFLRGGVLVAVSYPLVAYGAVGLASAYVVTGVVQTAVQVFFIVWLLRGKSREWDRRPSPQSPLDRAVA